ncbi:MAG: hypothetical protein ABIQ04_05280 [Candidatus Saccharimonadales bacterium]
MSNSPEKIAFGHEQDKNPEALEKIGIEQRERLREQLEKAGEKSKEKTEDARHEALENAKSIEHEKKRETDQKISPAERRKDGPIGKAERQASYNATMKQVRSELSGPSRTFSKVIHNSVVEKTSDAVGSTVARPNAILAGAVVAFLVTLGVYLVAKYYGYPLSGFESIGSFAIGWIIGLLFDYFRIMVTGKR